MWAIPIKSSVVFFCIVSFYGFKLVCKSIFCYRLVVATIEKIRNNTEENSDM